MVPHVYAGSLKWETVKINYSENIKHTVYPIKYLSDLLVIFLPNIKWNKLFNCLTQLYTCLLRIKVCFQVKVKIDTWNKLPVKQEAHCE